jgi:hypothetical protein
VGVLGGVPLTDTTSGHDESPRYVVGPTIEMRLPAGFAVEADALYRRFGNSNGFSLSNGSIGFITVAIGTVAVTNAPFIASFANRERGNAWEFPLLGKYYFRPRTSSWQPFAGTGFAFRTVARHDFHTQAVTDANGALQTSTFKSDFRTPLEVGAVVAAGLRYRAGRFAISPQVRYTRWGGTDNLVNRNEVGLMLGVAF